MIIEHIMFTTARAGRELKMSVKVVKNFKFQISTSIANSTFAATNGLNEIKFIMIIISAILDDLVQSNHTIPCQFKTTCLYIDTEGLN